MQHHCVARRVSRLLLQQQRYQQQQYRHLSTGLVRLSPNGDGRFRRSDLSGQGFTGYYDAGAPTKGPLADASLLGAPRITPRLLKQHLDEYVVGQDRAKKILSVAVYNHYLRVQELQRREDEEAELLAQQLRREYVRHPVEDEFPGQQETINLHRGGQQHHLNFQSGSAGGYSTTPGPILDSSPLNIEKSNVLLLGPSGVGKTLMAKTLARILEVPYSTSDCNTFTQAGYIGEDADVCVQRLLAAANYDVAKAERGIIVLDEIDKIATARVSHGKDVSGEGVQQALLKIIEGTTVQVHAKQERNSGGGSGPQNSGSRSHSHTAGAPGGPGLGSGFGGAMPPPPIPPSRSEVYNVQTDNILFICTGAFIGLHKAIMDRVSKGSIGFGAPMRTFTADASKDGTDPTLPMGNKDDEELFRKHLPFYEPAAPHNSKSQGRKATFSRSSSTSGGTSSSKSPPSSSSSSTSSSFSATETSTESSNNATEHLEIEDVPRYNTLDLTTPRDLQTYGMIPELIGRLPITCALSPLNLPSLVRVLTEPRNSLLAQYTQLFALSNIELRFTTPALYEVARSAQGMGTGARGLRTVMERLLTESQFECPGAGIRHVLVTEKAAKKEEPVKWFARGAQASFQNEAADEEEEWDRRTGRDGAKRRRDARDHSTGNFKGGFESFEQYRERVTISGNG